ncbi:MAG: hypothetical protein L3J43_01400 [Sulfurovum sp.]|nr:hypothetical protein [Sulfurovum sp.]
MIKVLFKTFILIVVILSGTLLYQKHTYAYHTLAQIDPLPQTKALIKASHYADAHVYLQYFMAFDYVKKNPDAIRLLHQIKSKRDSISYQSDKVLEGIATGKSDEVLGQASAIGSDFFLIGDLRDLAIEATHYFKDEEVDSFLVALSSVGLVATAGTLFSGGSTGVVKAGVSVLKLAQKSKCIPPWLHGFIVKQSKQIRKHHTIASLTPLFNTLQTLQKQTGLRQTLKLLSTSTSLKGLQKLIKLSHHYGKDTAMLLKLSDKQILKHANRFKQVNTKTIKLASSYGSNGFTHLLKGGEKNFLKTTLRLKSYSKVGYKGDAWKIFLTLMKSLNDKLLLLVMSVGFLFLLPWRGIINYSHDE